MNYRDIPHAQTRTVPDQHGLDAAQVIDQLAYGSPLLDRVKMPEGLAWWEVGKRLEEAQMVRFEDFDKLVHDPAFLRHWGIPFDSAEGFLFPDTYLIMRPLELNEATAKSVVGRLIDNFWRIRSLSARRQAPGPFRARRGTASGHAGLHRRRETAVPSERPRVAGVYANRLRLNMLLQADPTTAYGLGKGSTAICGANISTTKPTPTTPTSTPACRPAPSARRASPASKRPLTRSSTTTSILSRAEMAPMCSAPI